MIRRSGNGTSGAKQPSADRLRVTEDGQVSAVHEAGGNLRIELEFGGETNRNLESRRRQPL